MVAAALKNNDFDPLGGELARDERGGQAAADDHYGALR
jgi:hypothetical protein